MATLFSRLLHIVSKKGEVEEVTAFGRWKDFIVAAERAWLNVFDAGKPTSLLSADGAPLLLLPPEFSTRRKIYSYFRRWWGPRLASNMLYNLPLCTRADRLYVIAYDIPPISLNVSKVTRIGEQPDGILLQTVLTGGFDEPLLVRHFLQIDPRTKALMITDRSDKEDFRYRPRTVCLEE